MMLTCNPWFGEFFGTDFVFHGDVTMGWQRSKKQDEFRDLEAIPQAHQLCNTSCIEGGEQLESMVKSLHRLVLEEGHNQW